MRLLLGIGLALSSIAGCGPSPEAQRAAAADAADAERRLEAQHEEARARDEAQRLEALWVYASTSVDGAPRPQRTASVRNARPDEDDPASFAVVPTVLMVLRDDPRWGQSVYLVVEDGRFDCGRPCAFNITLDDAEPKRFAGEASSTGTRPALFIKDDAGFIRALDAATTVRIAPVDGRADPIDFEVAGFDIARYKAGG